MTYGIIKVDTVTFTNAGIDKSVTISGLVQNPTFSGDVTVIGTLSGVTVTGTTANFTSGNFTNISGGTHTITSGVFAAGSAASPSITFTGDLNTGIYSPGVDQVSVTTGGTERLRVDANGQIEVVSLGTAAAPVFSFTTDPNTGIYSPGADQVAISANSAERMRITTTGVGIGTSSPDTSLHVASTSPVLRFENPTTTSTTGTSMGKIEWETRDASAPGVIGYIDVVDSNNFGTAFDMQLATGVSGAATTKVTIKADGKVGIGTSSPGALLSLAGSSAYTVGNSGLATQGLDVNAPAGGSGLFGGAISFGVGGTGRASISSTQGTADNDTVGLVFNTHVSATGSADAVEAMRITHDGKVGIGTSVPNAILSTKPSASSTTTATTFTGDGLFIDCANTTDGSGNYGGAISWSRSGSSTTRAAAIANVQTSGDADIQGLAFLTHNSSTSTNPLIEAMRITGAGNVGIGTTSPGGTLDIKAAASTAPLIVQGPSSEFARIDSSGKLLVGTSSALTNIYTGATAATPQIQLSGAGLNESSLSLLRTGPTGATVFLNAGSSGNAAQSSSILGRFIFNGFDGTNYRTGGQIVCEVDGTPGTDDMPGRIVLSTTADGANIPTERFRITNDGVKCYDQPAPAAVNATATLTVANLKASIITSTSAAATDMTLPTGTDTQAGFTSTYDNFTFEWSVINTGPSLVRVLAATAHTIVGSGSVATGTSGRFASRRTAANTFVTYRLS